MSSKLRLHIRGPQREFVDYDYLAKLSPEELEWLRSFTDLYYCGPANRFFDAAGYTEEQKKQSRRRKYAADNDFYGKSAPIRKDDL